VYGKKYIPPVWLWAYITIIFEKSRPITSDRNKEYDPFSVIFTKIMKTIIKD